MKLKYGISVLIVLVVSLYASRIQAAFLGADLTYVSLGGDSFQVKVTVYSECRSASSLSATPILLTEIATQKSLYVNTSKASGYDFTPLCSSACNPCSSGSCTGGFGYHADYLYATINLTEYKKGGFNISWSKCCRSNDITTGSAGESFYTEAYLNNSVKKNNSSPQFKLPPQLVLLNNQYYAISPGVSNDDSASADYDSLYFKWVSPLKDKGTSVSYSPSYSATYPFLFNGYPYGSFDFNNQRGFYIDPQTGVIYVKPVQADISVMAYAVEEWHKDGTGKWMKISEVRRDYQVQVVQDSMNHLPFITGPDGPATHKIYFQAGKSKCFTISASDPDQGDSVKLNWLGSMPGIGVSGDAHYSKTPSITICWKPTKEDARKYPYMFTVSARDNNCYPFTGTQQNVYMLFVDTFPEADFRFNNVCIGHKMSFTNLTDDPYGYINYAWDFGDGKTSTSESPTHLYSTSGKYVVKLAISYGNRKIDSIQKTVYVVTPPHANISVNQLTQCADNNSYFFYAPKDTATTYFWELGNGNTSDSSAVWATYADTGSYTVRLFMKSKMGCSDSGSLQVHVVREAADFSFDKDSIQCVHNNTFKPKANITIKDPVWDFGDGYTTTLLTPSHSYGSPGHYTVTLSGTTASGCGVHATHTAVITDITPGFTSDNSTNCTNVPFHFSNASSSTENLPLACTWSFGDGSSSTEENPSHAYIKGGDYKVILSVTDGKGCTERTSQNIYVPVVSAAFSTSAAKDCAGIPFSFSNQSTASDSTPMQYTWDFGDNDTSHAVNPVHSYANPGKYMVKLSAQLASGCADSFSNIINIYSKPIVTIFGPDSVALGDTATFSAGHDVEGTFDWNTGAAAQISSDANLIRLRWDNVGIFPISVRGKNNNTDCEDSAAATVKVYEPEGIQGLHPVSWRLLKMYPNPAHDRLSLEFSSARKEQVYVHIYDVNGRELQSNTFSIYGHSQQAMSLNGLPAGLYLVRIVSAEGESLQKLFVE